MTEDAYPLLSEQLRHAMRTAWHTEKRDEFIRAACGVWPWDQGDDELITSDAETVNCPKCLEIEALTYGGWPS